jgi:hypothetical protein
MRLEKIRCGKGNAATPEALNRKGKPANDGD